MLSFARSRGIADGDDILGDVLLAISRALDRFQGDVVDLKAFALKVARDRIADRYRRGPGRFEVAVAEMPEEAWAGDVAGAVASRDLVRRALARLPEAQRDAVFLNVVLDLPAEHVARVLGKRPGTIRVLVHRALLRLRSELGEPLSANSPVGGSGI